MKIHALPVLCSIIICLFAAGCSQKSQVETRIKAVEEGLEPGLPIATIVPTGHSLTDRMKHYDVPAVSIAVINNGRVEWSKGYGVIDKDSQIAATPTTLFQAASISKALTAMASLYFVQEGKLRLDQNINDLLVSWHLPDNEYTRVSKVTLRELLSHSSGLNVPNFSGYPADSKIPALREILDGTPPANSPAIRVQQLPGTDWRYSGGGYVVIQELLEEVTGQAFPEIMKQSVFDKLQMNHSSFDQPLPDDLQKQVASGYLTSGNMIKGKWNIYPELAAVGLWSTPSDLALYVLNVQSSLDGKSEAILSQKTATEMITPQIDHWGLGLKITGEGDTAYFSHPGVNEGFISYLIGYSKLGKGAVIMTNSNNGRYLIKEIIDSIARVYNWPDFSFDADN